MYRKLLLKLVLSLAIATFFLWLCVDHLAADASETIGTSLWDALKQSVSMVSIGDLALYSLIFLGVHLARIYRWQYLVTPLGETDRKKIFRICAVGFSAIVILPLRLGEMVRPYMLARESKYLTMSAALGTAVVERVIDGLLITGLLFLSIASYSGSQPTTFATTAGLVAALIFVGASFVLLLGSTRHDLTVALLTATVGRFSTKLNELIIGLVDSFLDGVRVLRKEHVLLRFLIVTFIYWGLNGIGIAVLARAFGIDLGLWQAYGVLAILVVGIMIPAGPGFFGNFQFFLGKGLLLFVAANQVTVLAFGLTLNVIQLILQIGFGVPFFFASHIGVRRLLEAASPEQPEPSA